MQFEVGTMIAQLLSILLIIGFFFFIVVFVFRYFRGDSKRLKEIEKKIEKLENQRKE